MGRIRIRKMGWTIGRRAHERPKKPTSIRIGIEASELRKENPNRIGRFLEDKDLERKEESLMK